MNQEQYLELNQNLSEFYLKKVESNLVRYNEIRKAKAKLVYLNWGLLAAVVFSIACGFISQFVPFFANVALISFICGFVLSIILSKKNKNNAPVSENFEQEIKSELMDGFVKIFGDFNWKNGAFMHNKKIARASELMPYVSKRHKDKIIYETTFNPEFYKNVQEVAALNLFNFASLDIDDCIYGVYENVKVSMLETRTISGMKMLLFILPLLFTFMIPIAIILLLFILVFGFFGFLSILSNYYDMIYALMKFGIPKVVSVLVTASIFILVVKFILQLIINKFIKPLCGHFRGVIVEFTMNKNFEGQTIILDNTADGRCVRVNKKKYNVVNLEDVEFMKDYTVYSDNQIEARYLITTAFIDRLKNIKNQFKCKYLRVAFKDNKIVIAVHTDRDMFKMADMNSDTGKETFMALFNEILSVLEFIEQLKLNQKLGL